MKSLDEEERRPPIDSVSIRNFHRVNDWLFRGGQPKREEFSQLESLGVRSVVSFRYSTDTIKDERNLVTQANMNLFCIPLSYIVLPTRAEIAKFFAVVDDPSNYPIFVHCLHGSDRTGMMIAMYRIARDNWTADEAYREMKEFGFHKFTVYQFKWAVYGFAARLKRERKMLP